MASGKEPDPFGRQAPHFPIQKGPYYAMLAYLASLISFGGLDATDELQVRNHKGEVIPGLYAAGEIIGAAATTGNAFASGMLLTPALSFGRWLGERL